MANPHDPYWLIFDGAAVHDDLFQGLVAGPNVQLTETADGSGRRIVEITAEEFPHDHSIYLRHNGSIEMTGALNFYDPVVAVYQKAINLGDPTAARDAVNLQYLQANYTKHHGDLDGLGDDDHTQYFLQDGSEGFGLDGSPGHLYPHSTKHQAVDLGIAGSNEWRNLILSQDATIGRDALVARILTLDNAYQSYSRGWTTGRPSSHASIGQRFKAFEVQVGSGAWQPALSNLVFESTDGATSQTHLALWNGAASRELPVIGIGTGANPDTLLDAEPIYHATNAHWLQIFKNAPSNLGVGVKINARTGGAPDDHSFRLYYDEGHWKMDTPGDAPTQDIRMGLTTNLGIHKAGVAIPSTLALLHVMQNSAVSEHVAAFARGAAGGQTIIRHGIGEANYTDGARYGFLDYTLHGGGSDVHRMRVDMHWLPFQHNTWDIGSASDIDESNPGGTAMEWRDLRLARDAYIGGDLDVTGAITGDLDTLTSTNATLVFSDDTTDSKLTGDLGHLILSPSSTDVKLDDEKRFNLGVGYTHGGYEAGMIVSDVPDSTLCTAFMLRPLNAFTTTPSQQYYFDFRDASDNTLICAKANGTLELGGRGTSGSGFTVIGGTRDEAFGLLFMPFNEGAGTIAFGDSNVVSPGYFSVRPSPGFTWTKGYGVSVDFLGGAYSVPDAAAFVGSYTNATSPDITNAVNMFTHRATTYGGRGTSDCATHRWGMIQNIPYTTGTKKVTTLEGIRCEKLDMGLTNNRGIIFEGTDWLALVFNQDTEYIDSQTAGHLDFHAATSIDMNADVDISTKNIITDTVTGTQLATATTQLLAFWGATPVDRPAATADINDSLQEVGLIPASSPTGYYGELYAFENTIATTISVQNTWYQFTEFTNTGQSAGATPSTATDDITIDNSGVYLVTASISFSGGGGKTYEINVKKNNGATSLTNLHSERKLGSAGDIGSVSISGLAQLTATDTVELWIRCIDGTTADATLEHVNLSVYRIGD